MVSDQNHEGTSTLLIKQHYRRTVWSLRDREGDVGVLRVLPILGPYEAVIFLVSDLL